ncbi:hypothetical protein [Ectothiorhodospira lacustris]|uniref:hypothetical protein n=1 Tax=Ectothiorhodospira lacustris TaxID=2899127 RepID=UPI001EE989F4|nr:hypothetical protein [Ectothiorhodospira lacustris]MCG5502212.1 hypothetical protein [Ectothiorhodospira lacustris]
MNKDPRQVLIELNQKFNGNFAEWKSLTDHKLEKSFVGLHCIAAVGEILEDHKASKHHDICCKIYDEIFSDGVASIYLASNAMNKPACIVLRRVLELGLAAIYLWDMPHMAFSWKQHDQNPSFTEMLKHINSKGYASYIANENNMDVDGDMVPMNKAQEIYGTLSDIAHGKITTFETSMPERFKFAQDDWKQFVAILDAVVEMLVSAFLVRFNIASDVFGKVPQAKKEFNLSCQ